MAGSVVDRHLLKIERIHPLKACDIDTVLLGILTAPVMGVNATARAEVMLCSVGIELVHGEQFAALRNADAVQIRRHRNRPAHATVRTRTTPRRAKPIGQSCCEPHSTAMAGAVDRIYGGLHARLLIRYSNK